MKYRITVEEDVGPRGNKRSSPTYAQVYQQKLETLDLAALVVAINSTSQESFPPLLVEDIDDLED